MSCARCGCGDDSFKVSLTNNYHDGLCQGCGSEWAEHSATTGLWRNRSGTWVPAFRRWCEARRTA